MATDTFIPICICVFNKTLLFKNLNLKYTKQFFYIQYVYKVPVICCLHSTIKTLSGK